MVRWRVYALYLKFAQFKIIFNLSTYQVLSEDKKTEKFAKSVGRVCILS